MTSLIEILALVIIRISVVNLDIKADRKESIFIGTKELDEISCVEPSVLKEGHSKLQTLQIPSAKNDNISMGAYFDLIMIYHEIS